MTLLTLAGETAKTVDLTSWKRRSVGGGGEQRKKKRSRRRSKSKRTMLERRGRISRSS